MKTVQYIKAHIHSMAEGYELLWVFMDKGFFFNLRHSKIYSWLLHWGYAVLDDAIWWFLFCGIFNCVKIYRMWLRTAWKNWTTHHPHVIMQAIHPCMKHALEVIWKSPGCYLCMGLMLVIVPLVESGNFWKNCCVVDTWNYSSLLHLIPERVTRFRLILFRWKSKDNLRIYLRGIL